MVARSYQVLATYIKKLLICALVISSKTFPHQTLISVSNILLDIRNSSSSLYFGDNSKDKTQWTPYSFSSCLAYCCLVCLLALAGWQILPGRLFKCGYLWYKLWKIFRWTIIVLHVNKNIAHLNIIIEFMYRAAADRSIEILQSFLSIIL